MNSTLEYWNQRALHGNNAAVTHVDVSAESKSRPCVSV